LELNPVAGNRKRRNLTSVGHRSRTGDTPHTLSKQLSLTTKRFFSPSAEAGLRAKSLGKSFRSASKRFIAPAPEPEEDTGAGDAGVSASASSRGTNRFSVSQSAGDRGVAVGALGEALGAEAAEVGSLAKHEEQQLTEDMQVAT
jgi:hypothetical protein